MKSAIKATPEGVAALRAAKEHVQQAVNDADGWGQTLDGVTGAMQGIQGESQVDAEHILFLNLGRMQAGRIPDT